MQLTKEGPVTAIDHQWTVAGVDSSPETLDGIEHKSVVTVLSGGLAELTLPVHVTLLAVRKHTILFTLEGGQRWGVVLLGQALRDTCEKIEKKSVTGNF